MGSAGCRDCAMCTGHAFTGAGRSIGRATADIATLGISHLARRKCKVCGHPMSEHLGKSAEMVVAATSDVRNETYAAPVKPKAAKPNPARWVKQLDGQHRWWDGEGWTEHYTLDPATYDYAAAAAKIEAAAAPAIETPVPSTAVTPASDPVAQIKQLAELRDAGILTEEEFAAKKAEILARM